MAKYKGMPSFEMIEDEDDSQTAEDDTSNDAFRLQYCFRNDQPAPSEILREYNKVRSNLKRMTNQEIVDECPPSLKILIEDGLKKLGRENVSVDEIAVEIKNFLNAQTPETIAEGLDIEAQLKDLGECVDDLTKMSSYSDDIDLEEFGKNTLDEFNKLADADRELIINTLHPYTQAELDEHTFYDAFVMDFFPAPEAAAEMEFYGKWLLGKNIINEADRPRLDISVFDLHEQDLWIKVFYNDKQLFKADLEEFFRKYCNGLDWINKWEATIDEDGIIEFRKDCEQLIQEFGKDPISELSEYVNVRYYIDAQEMKDCLETYDQGVAKLEKMLKDKINESAKHDDKDDEVEDSSPHENVRELLQSSAPKAKAVIQVSPRNGSIQYDGFPSDSDFYLRDKEAFSCSGYIPTNNLYELFIEKFGNHPTVEELLIEAGIPLKGVKIDYTRYSVAEPIKNASVAKKYVMTYFNSKAPTATGCYVIFYIGSKGTFEGIVPSFGNSINPQTGDSYDIRYNRDYFTENGQLKEFDIRRVQTQLEMILYPISKTKLNIKKLGTLTPTIDIEPDLTEGRMLLGRLRFNDSAYAESFKSENNIDSDYINVYFKSKAKVAHKSTFMYLSEYLYTLEDAFVESKLLENVKIKEDDGRWYIDIRLPKTIEFLDAMFQD